MSGAKVQHVSDTALWVAVYRAQESERKDALFKDPLAAKLVGDRGREIARSMGFSRPMALAMAVRTVAIDRLIERALQLGADTVINLGAGLDTRPYRMPLPAQLRWVEVDFPGMIQYKNDALAQERPACRLERIPLDLANDDERRNLFQRLGTESGKAVVLTEGVIPYLTNDQAERLARDLFAVPAFRWWIQDYQHGGLQRFPTRGLAWKLKKRSPFRFEATHYFRFFERCGWSVFQDIRLIDEAERIGRPLEQMHPPWTWPLKLMPKPMREYWNERFGYVMYSRAEDEVK